MEIKLLVVEDDFATLNLYLSVLRHRFPHVVIHSATTPGEAIAAFTEHLYDIVISDVRVPNRKDGYVIAKTICALKPDVALYFVTADDWVVKEELGPNVQKLCVRDIVGKPFGLQELYKKIGDAIALVEESKTSTPGIKDEDEGSPEG